MARKQKNNQKPQVNPEIGDFDITINEFGEIVSTLDADKINKFLDKNLTDKKLKEHPDFKDNQNKTE